MYLLQNFGKIIHKLSMRLLMITYLMFFEEYIIIFSLLYVFNIIYYRLKKDVNISVIYDIC